MKQKENILRLSLIEEVLVFAWKIFRARPLFTVLVPMGVFIVAGLIVGIILILSNILMTIVLVFVSGFTSTWIMISVATFALIFVVIIFLLIFRLSVFAIMFQYRLLLDVVTGKDRTVKEIINEVKDVKLASRFFAGTILWTLMVGVGLLLLIVPGVILAIKYMFVPYFIIDKKMGIRESFKESAISTTGHKWQLFLFFFAVSIIAILAGIVIGNLIVTPFVVVISIYVYLMLNGEKKRLIVPTKKATIGYVVIVFIISIVLNILTNMANQNANIVG